MSFQYKRILLKISGEALGDAQSAFDNATLERIVRDILSLHETGVQIGVVIGGGNICRGTKVKELGIDRVTGDYMGMLATSINALAVQSKLEALNLKVLIQSAISMPSICEQYNRFKAIECMKLNHIVLFSCGTGHPFFTTDTAAVLRAIETDCDVMVKYTQVNGVYSADPKKNQDAIYYREISYDKVIRDNLAVMDFTAITLAQENRLPLIVCSIQNTENLEQIIRNNQNYTIVS